ncbi:lipopolysaccharide biosynthesis protein [Limnohabitans sp. T6-5]|uniref:Wzz/FepE/Etk N-terminal domain-containing protein n=1 Tax=Limnohabitans sp. T6-5 TaxID=1100724 RepID=UPI000D349DB4|nr:Wzz/FepE/Etk N-terminal domain-containing protein [Limnohabitans sp. T6-5]PUE08618.1 lipopolysaccharide biosynthesis protein [Limnohabitans sp. T6-5]
MTDTAYNPADTDDDEINLLDLLQTVVDNLRLLVLGPLVAGVLALGITFVVKPTFTAETSFLPPQQQQGMAASMLAGLGGLAGSVSGLKNPADQYVAFLKSNSIKDALIDRFKLLERYDVKLRTTARKALDANVKIANGKDGLITVNVDDIDPQIAADMANAHVQELTQLMGRLAVTEAQQRRHFFEKQLQQTKDKLTQAEIQLKETGISGDVLKSNPASALTAVAALQAQVTVQEVKIGAMRGYLADTAPDFKQALNELANLRAQLAKQSKDTTSSTGKGQGIAQGDYVTKYREFKYQETLFELFAKQFEIAKLDEAREGAVIQVLDAAQPPERKSKPKKVQIAIYASLATGFVLLLFVFIRQALRNASKDNESAQKLSALKASWHKAIGKTR